MPITLGMYICYAVSIICGAIVVVCLVLGMYD